MAVWNGNGDRIWNALRRGRRGYGQQPAPCRALRAFAVRATKYAPRARVARRSFEISTHRLSHAHLRFDKVGERCGTLARSRIPGHSPRTARSNGPQEHSGNGQLDWRL